LSVLLSLIVEAVELIDPFFASVVAANVHWLARWLHQSINQSIYMYQSKCGVIAPFKQKFAGEPVIKPFFSILRHCTEV